VHDGAERKFRSISYGRGPGAVRNRLAASFALGLAASAIAMVVTRGLRSDLIWAVATASFWITFAFTGLLALAGAVAVESLAHPEGSARRAGVLGGAIVLARWALLPLNSSRAHRATIDP
jgi:hypothetical protein